MKSSPDIENHEAYSKYRGMAFAGDDYIGKVDAGYVFDRLHDHYVMGRSKREIADEFEELYNMGRSYILRILSNKNGEDTSRRTYVRRCFGLYMEKIGMGNPFKEYKCPTEKRKKKGKPSLGIIGASDGN